MDVFQITKSVFCNDSSKLTAAISNTAQDEKQKKDLLREKERKTKTGKGLARETKILHPARNTACSFQTGNSLPPEKPLASGNGRSTRKLISQLNLCKMKGEH